MKFTQHESITIKPQDVLCGRGGHSNNHPGNKLFRRIIQENKEIYQELCDQSAKKQMLVSSIVQAIQHFGGRFVRKQPTSQKREGGDTFVWVEISEKEARTKTTQALREQTSPSPTSTTTTGTSAMKSPLHSHFREALRKSNQIVRQTPSLSSPTSPAQTHKTHVRRVSRDYSVLENNENIFRTPSAESLPALVSGNSFDSQCSSSSGSGVWTVDDAVLGDISNTIEGEHSPLLIENDDDQEDSESYLTKQSAGIMEDPFCPLDVSEMFFETSAEFGRMCSSLLDVLVQ